MPLALPVRSKDDVEDEESDRREYARAADRRDDGVREHRDTLIAFEPLDPIVGRPVTMPGDILAVLGR